LRGFEAAWDGFNSNLTDDVRASFSSPLLRRMCVLPNLEPSLEVMHSYFDWDEARDSGTITPHQGLDPNMDAALDTVQNILDKLASHLKEAKTCMSSFLLPPSLD
jgi:hypothetical protein